MSKNLVVFYSRKGENHMPGGIQVLEKGHTHFAAEFIAKAVNADIFEIDTVKPYAANYRECCMEAVAEIKSGARPEIKGYVDSIADYDNIFVCFPCWCGTAPMCVFTFLEHYDLTGKTIVPFCTHEGSGFGNSLAELARICPGAVIAPAIEVKGCQVEQNTQRIVDWCKTVI